MAIIAQREDVGMEDVESAGQKNEISVVDVRGDQRRVLPWRSVRCRERGGELGGGSRAAGVARVVKISRGYNAAGKWG